MTQSRGRARIGILVPFTNTNLEPDMALMCPNGVSLHYARMAGYDADEIPDETQMHGLGKADIDVALQLLSGVKPDVVMYGCTSATLTHGMAFDRHLSRHIMQKTGAQTVTAAGALVCALQFLGVSRIGFASPYVPAINEMAIEFLASTHIETVNRSEVTEILDNDGQGALRPDEVFELGLKADHPDAEALVLSCTDMRSVEIISRLEATIGKPVVSSNQAMQFEMLQKIGIDTEYSGFGSLLTRVRSGAT